MTRVATFPVRAFPLVSVVAVESCNVRTRLVERCAYVNEQLFSVEMLLGDEWVSPLELLSRRFVS